MPEGAWGGRSASGAAWAYPGGRAASMTHDARCAPPSCVRGARPSCVDDRCPRGGVGAGGRACRGWAGGVSGLVGAPATRGCASRVAQGEAARAAWRVAPGAVGVSPEATPSHGGGGAGAVSWRGGGRGAAMPGPSCVGWYPVAVMLAGLGPCGCGLTHRNIHLNEENWSILCVVHQLKTTRQRSETERTASFFEASPQNFPKHNTNMYWKILMTTSLHQI